MPPPSARVWLLNVYTRRLSGLGDRRVPGWIQSDCETTTTVPHPRVVAMWSAAARWPRRTRNETFEGEPWTLTRNAPKVHASGSVAPRTLVLLLHLARAGPHRRHRHHQPVTKRWRRKTRFLKSFLDPPAGREVAHRFHFHRRRRVSTGASSPPRNLPPPRPARLQHSPPRSSVLSPPGLPSFGRRERDEATLPRAATDAPVTMTLRKISLALSPNE